MFSAQSLLVGNGTSVTCLRKSREPITALNVATYVTPLMVRNFWLRIRCGIVKKHKCFQLEGVICITPRLNRQTLAINREHKQ